MKFIVKSRKVVQVFATLCTFILAGCQEGDGDADYGFSRIYMPQSSVTGIDNHYPVPGGSGVYTYNFRVDTLPNGAPDKIQIILGVARSGKISGAGGFVVNVHVLPEMTDEAVNEIEDALVLPSGIYTLPDQVAVEAGKNSAAFYLTVDINNLMDGAYDGKNLALAVGISEPAVGFDPEADGTSVIVVIDVDALRQIFYAGSLASVEF